MLYMNKNSNVIVTSREGFDGLMKTVYLIFSAIKDSLKNIENEVNLYS